MRLKGANKIEKKNIITNELFVSGCHACWMQE